MATTVTGSFKTNCTAIKGTATDDIAWLRLCTYYTISVNSANTGYVIKVQTQLESDWDMNVGATENVILTVWGNDGVIASTTGTAEAANSISVGDSGGVGPKSKEFICNYISNSTKDIIQLKTFLDWRAVVGSNTNVAGGPDYGTTGFHFAYFDSGYHDINISALPTLGSKPTTPTVTITTSSITETSMSVNWSSSATPTCSSIQWRYINKTASPDTSSSWNTVNVSKNSGTISVTGLKPNTTYNIEVKATNSIGTSAAGTDSTKTDSITPTFKYNAKGLYFLKYSWTCPVTVAEVAYRKVGTSTWTHVNVANGKSGTVTISGLSAGTTYNYEFTVNTTSDVWSHSYDSNIPHVSATTLKPISLTSGAITHGETFNVNTTGSTELDLSLKIAVGTVVINKSLSALGSKTITLSDTEWDNIYKKYTTTSTVAAKLTATGTVGSESTTDSVNATITLKGNQKTVKVGVANKPRRVKVWVGTASGNKRAVVWVKTASGNKRTI